MTQTSCFFCGDSSHDGDQERSWMLRLLDVWYNAFYVEEEYDDQADYDDR